MGGMEKSVFLKVLAGVSLIASITYTVLRIMEMEKAKKQKEAEKGCSCQGNNDNEG